MKTYLVLVVIFLNSCITTFPTAMGTFKTREFIFTHNSPVEQLNLESGTWLLMPLSANSYGEYERDSFELLQSYLEKKLGDRLVISNEVRDASSKMLLFGLDYDIIEGELEFVKNNSNCDYIISTKIEYAGDNSLFKEQNNLSAQHKAPCKIYLTGYSLSTMGAVLDVSCLSFIFDDDYEDEDSGIITQTPSSASRITMKKLIEHINF